MRRFLVVGPNGGASFGQGGGSYVAVKMVEALSQLPDSKVGLVSLWGTNLGTLAESFGITLPQSKVKSFFLFESRAHREPMIGTVTTPYLATILMSVLRLLQRAVENFNPDLIIFNDDSPNLRGKFRDKEMRTLLYGHFPYACRMKYAGQRSEISSPLRRASELAIMPIMKKLFETERVSVNWLVANSTVTRRYMHATFPSNDISTIFPPVDPFTLQGHAKSNLVVSLGAIQPNKRHQEVVEAIKMVRSSCKCFIIGHLRDVAYFRRLVRYIKESGMEGRVEIIPDAPKRTLVQILERSKVIVHPSRFEPFGISVVEGMNAGAVPVVYAGENSGPWIDVVARGKFGRGYGDTEELATELADLLGNETNWRQEADAAKARGKSFSTQAFSNKFLNLIGLT
jgi:glycosyltransferase involved in cell wall biosynthesis